MARKSTASSNQKKPNASRPRQRAASPAEKSARKAGAKAAPAVDSADHLFDERTRRDITGVVFAILAVVLMVAAILPSDAVVTSFVSQALHLTFGLGAYLLPLFLLACGISFLVRFDRERVPTRIAVGLGLVFVALLTLLALTMPVGPEGGVPEQIFDPDQLTLRGGYIGAGIAWAGYTLFGQVVSVIIMVGVNGTGKTTTAGKLARLFVADGKRVMMGAADTFRAAAADQLETWGAKVGVPVVRSDKDGADPASVAFEAAARAKDEHADVLIIDTAGRLQNKANLMDELGKIRRVTEKNLPVDEVLLVLDATTGQNGMTQAKVFAEAIGITGVVLSKLDGSAKGGIVISVQKELGVPVKLVGLGEGPDDLAPFDPEGFVDGILA